MIVAVTGASGLVGSSIVQALSDKNISSRSLVRSIASPGLLATTEGAKRSAIVEGDVLDMAGLFKAIDGADTVVHAAGFVSFSRRSREKIFAINVEGTKNVVNACLQAGVKNLVHISSVAALGRPRGVSTVDEESKWISGMPASDYATSKYLGELEVFRGMEEGLNVSVINPSVVLSAADGVRSSSQIFNYVWNQRLFYTNVTLNYVDVRDVSEMVLRLLDGNHNGERFIANGGATDLKNVFEMLGQRFQKRPPKFNVPTSLVNVAATIEQWRSELTGAEPMVSKQSVRFLRDKTLFENAKAKKVLGMQFQTLENTLDWCCERFRTVNINK